MTTRPRRPAPPDSAEHYDFSTQVGHLLRRAYQRHTALFQQIIPNDQLTAAQFVALCAIRDSDGCSLGHIVKRTAIDQATIRGIIDRLRLRKLVNTQQDEQDKRRVQIHLTKEGAALVQDMVPYAFEVSEMTFDDLNPAERTAMLYLLTKMCHADEVDDPQ